MIKVGIIGSTGYAGQELVRILMGHKEVEIKWYGSRSYIDKKYYEVYQNMFEMLYSWRQIAAKLEAGEITKEEYDYWRYKYPEFDFSKKDWKKVGVSQGLSDILVEGLKEE